MDTATKRYSAINVGSPWRGVLPLPDGSVDAADRPVVAFLYAFEAAESVVERRGGAFYPTAEELRRLRRELREKLEREKESEARLSRSITETYDEIIDRPAAALRAAALKAEIDEVSELIEIMDLMDRRTFH